MLGEGLLRNSCLPLSVSGHSGSIASLTNAGQCQYATLAESPPTRSVEYYNSDCPGADGRLRLCCISKECVVDRGAWFVGLCAAHPGRCSRGNGRTSPRNDGPLQSELFLSLDGST